MKEGGSIDTKLTVKQQKFCEYYVASGNATEAARKAGYSEKTAEVIAVNNLKKEAVKEYIAELMEKQTSERIMGATEVLASLSDIARGKTEEEVIVTVSVGDGYSEVRKVNKKVSERDRIKALELLGKRYMLFTDKVSMEGYVPVVIVGEDELED